MNCFLRYGGSLIIALVSSASFAAIHVQVDERVYEDIDQLLSFGVVKDVVYGQRPFSENEIQRIVKKATEFLEKNPDFKDKETVQRILNRISKSPTLGIFNKATVSFTQLNSSPR